MIWVLLCLLVVLMATPFILSWHYTSKKKRVILDVPDETSDVPRHRANKYTEESENELRFANLDAPAKSTYENPIYVEDKASFGENSKITACHAKELILAEKSYATSYLDADEYLSIGKECELLGSAECDGEMDVADTSSFYDLFARKIRFLGGASPDISHTNTLKTLKASKKSEKVAKNIRQVDDEEVIEKTIVTKHGLRVGKNAVITGDILSVIGVELDEDATVGGNIISHKDVSIGKNCNILGDISAEKDIELVEGTNVVGNVISQQNIKLGSGCHVQGNTFAQRCIEIDDDVTVGTKDQIKSVIAGDTVSICGNSTVYGRVRAIRGGKVNEGLR